MRLRQGNAPLKNLLETRPGQIDNFLWLRFVNVVRSFLLMEGVLGRCGIRFASLSDRPIGRAAVKKSCSQLQLAIGFLTGWLSVGALRLRNRTHAEKRNGKTTNFSPDSADLEKIDLDTSRPDNNAENRVQQAGSS